MSAAQTKIILVLFLLVPAGWVLSAWLLAYQPGSSPRTDHSQEFSAERAFELTREFVTRHPKRVLGSLEARQSSGFIIQRLKDLGYEVSFSHFDAVLANRKQVGRNVFGFKAGELEEIVAVLAHYDTAGTTVQGAMDNGSGIGVLLELARLMAETGTRRSFLFVATDGEEWGMLGAREFVRTYPERNLVVAGLSLDAVAVGELSGLRLETAGQFRGYTPPWLRQLSRDAATASGLAVSTASAFQEQLERALLLSSTDQGPLLHAGIPALNLGSDSRSPELQREVYHSEHDVIDNMEVSAFEPYGKVAETILRRLDAMDRIPEGGMSEFLVAGDRYLSSSVVSVLHILTFLPFFVVLSFHAVNHRERLSLGGVRRELLEFAGVLVPLMLVYASILFFSSLRLLPHYSLYPATPKDPVLEQPRWGVVAALLAVGVLSALGLYFIRRFLVRKLPRPDFHAAKVVLMALLSAVILAAFGYNSYWAVTFLSIPAWIWALVGVGRSTGARAANRICILGAGVVYYFVTIYFSSQLGTGGKILWYQILAIANGMFLREGILLATAAFSLGARFLAIQSYDE